MKNFSYQFKNRHAEFSVFGVKMKFDMSGNYLFHSLFNNNKIYILDDAGNKKQIFHSPRGLKIVFMGCGASVYLSKGSVYKSSVLKIYSNSVVKIAKTKIWGILNTLIDVGCDSTVDIGERFNMAGGAMSVYGGVKLSIGNDCMFADGINIMCGDGHRITDINTNEIINNPKSISIGNKVWLGRHSSVLKGARISDTSIVSLGAVVTSEFEDSNVILGGVPAKIIKRGIDWIP